MKKKFFVAALLLAALTAKAEVVSRDTVAYEGSYKLERIERTNDYGEINVRYVAHLIDMPNKNGTPKKVTITKKDYEGGQINAIIYNNGSDGSRKIAKACYVAKKGGNK